MFYKNFCKWLDSNCRPLVLERDHSANWATTTVHAIKQKNVKHDLFNIWCRDWITCLLPRSSVFCHNHMTGLKLFCFGLHSKVYKILLPLFDTYYISILQFCFLPLLLFVVSFFLRCTYSIFMVNFYLLPFGSRRTIKIHNLKQLRRTLTSFLFFVSCSQFNDN